MVSIYSNEVEIDVCPSKSFNNITFLTGLFIRFVVSVCTRDVIRQDLLFNAVGLILTHNHPSVELEPSNANRNITRELNQAAEMFEMKVLNHFVIRKSIYVSFAERGWI